MTRTVENPTAILSDIMTADPACLAVDVRLCDALSLMLERRIGSVLLRDPSVKGSEGAAGILTMRDLVSAAARGLSLHSPAAESMSRPVLALPGSVRLEHAYGRMRRAGIRHLLVTASDGAAIGIASETDFYRHLSRDRLPHGRAVRDVLDDKVPRVPPEGSGDELLGALCDAPCGCVAVRDDDRLLAILSEQDLLRRLHLAPDLADRRVAELLDGCGPVAAIGLEASLAEGRDALERAGVRHLAVLDEGDRFAGVLSFRGLISAGLPGPARVHPLPVDRSLRQRLRQFQRAVQQSPVSVVITDPEGNIEHANLRFCEITGYRESEVLGRNPRVLNSGVHPPAFYQGLWRVIASGQVWRGQLCNRRKDGSLYWEAATISPICDDRGRIVNFVGVKEEITERKRIADALRESESNYRNLVESLSEEYVLYRQDPEGRWSYLSPSVERLLGYQPEDFLGRQESRLTDHPLNRHRPIAARMARAGYRAEPYEVEIFDRAGERRRLRLSEGPVFDAAGRVAAVQGIAQDVTDHHLARLLLDGRNRVLERLARGCPLGEVLDALVCSIQEVDPEVLAGVHILDPDGVHLRVGAAPGLPTHYNRAVDGLAVREGVGSCGTAIVRNRLVVCEDILSHPDWAAFRDLVLTTDLRACWSHPIRGGDGRVLGAFALYYREPRRPRERELQLIESAADLAAVVLEHASARAALQRAEERERLLLDSTNDGILGLDREGVATFANPAAARMLGYDVHELCGAEIPRLLRGLPPVPERGSDGAHTPEPVPEVLIATTRDGHPRHLVGEILCRRDGTGFSAELWCNPVLHRGELIGSVITFRDIGERLEQERRIRHLAFHDALTGLPNRNRLMERLERELSRLRGESHRFALLLIDLDHFKDVNDSLGHAAGDELLQVTAARLRGEVRAEDEVARMGGDELAVIETRVGRVECVLGLARRLLASLSRPMTIRGREVAVSASIGVVLVDAPTEADTVMARADLALYRAKDRGRNRFALFEAEMAAALERELVIVGSFPEAIANGDLTLLYQPLVRIPSRVLHGVEALVRWQHPRLGSLLAADFVPVLERRGVAGRLDGWVLAQAAGQCRDWAARGLRFGRLAVNLSTLHPDDGQGARCPVELVRDQGVDPSHLELELTERLLKRAPDEAIATVAALQAAGMGIAIDDFGTGNASLACVRRFSPCTLKIARSLIAEMLADRGDAGMVKAAIALGRSLGLALVAEGVEEPAQADFLIAHGCDLVQGYAFGAPMEAQALETGFLRPAGSRPETG